MAKVDFRDYYQTLGVDKSADEKALRSAFRKLARKFHPDVNPGDATAEEKFKEINEAFEVLSDVDKRKLYDRFGEDWQRYKEAGFTGDEPAGAERQQDFGSWYSGGNRSDSRYYESDASSDSDYSDFFNTVFSSRSGRFGSEYDFGSTRTRQPARGSDLEASVDVTFQEAFAGTTRQFDIQLSDQGAGSYPRSRTIEVVIPPGVSTGSRIRVAGQGGEGRNGGTKGDVYLKVNVMPDARFVREGDNLKVDVSVPLYTALLGGEAIVNTPTGKVALNIPPETEQGKVFRLRKKGMPKLKKKGEFGDLLATANIQLPTNLTTEERDLVEQLKRMRSAGGS